MAREKSQPSTYPRKTTEHTQEPPATTINLIKAIQTIKAFVKSTGWPKRTRDIWKHVKKTAFSKADRDISNILKDIQELKS